MLELKTIKEQQRTTLEATGRINNETAGQFADQALAILNEGCSELVLDFGNLSYMSSAGLRSLLIIAKASKAKNIPVAICKVEGMVRDVLDTSGFDSFFELRHERDK